MLMSKIRKRVSDVCEDNVDTIHDLCSENRFLETKHTSVAASMHMSLPYHVWRMVVYTWHVHNHLWVMVLSFNVLMQTLFVQDNHTTIYKDRPYGTMILTFNNSWIGSYFYIIYKWRIRNPNQNSLVQNYWVIELLLVNVVLAFTEVISQASRQCLFAEKVR